MAAHRLPDVTVVAEVIIHLALQGALEDRLRQLSEPAALAGRLQPAGRRPLGQRALA